MGSHCYKKLTFEGNKLTIEGHHTVQELWDFLTKNKIKPNIEVKEVEIKNIRRGVEHLGLQVFPKLEKVVFGPGIKRIPFDFFQPEYSYKTPTGEVLQDTAFKNLKEVVCLDVELIESYAFWKSGVRKVSIYSPCKIMPNSFRDCRKLSEINLVDGSYIGKCAFANTAIENVAVPDNCVVSLMAFGGMRTLKAISIADSCKVRFPVVENDRRVEIDYFNKPTKIM